MIAGLSLIAGGVALFVWLCFMHKFLKANFKDGVRIDRDKRKLSDRPDLLSQQIEYHNKATYRALEFYVKVLLAVLGGVAVIVFKRGALADDGRILLLVYAAGWIVVLVTFVFCVMILVHQKSKIERWLFAPKSCDLWIWNETWFFVTSVIIGVFTALVCWIVV
jgi:hypothetical protein